MQKLIFTNSRGQSITLDNSSPYTLSKVEGLGDVDADIQTQKAPFQNGSTFIDSTLEERHILIEVSMSVDYERISDTRSLFSSVFNPILGEGKLTYIFGDAVKEINAVSEHLPKFPSGSDERFGGYQLVLISLRCPDPYWRSPQLIEEPMAAFVELFEFPFDDYFEMGIEGHTRYFTNDSDTEVPLKIAIKGPTSYPTLTNVTTGEFIKVKRTLSANDVLEINTEDGNKYVLLNGEDAFSWIDINSVFFKLAIGENEIRYTADAGQESATLTIEWQERYNAV
ncbi:phage tail family protein [Robertmurraya sp. DFI.2.37]|uniref:phage tail family protein n=1 Tax=Robertmurraya sp. DFI.2.37 TaxID=3031819 RepID=UPI001248471C|nr:phage tail family protein [Robertmurraya sp. DFI.2.37]MDF1510602.1 phage tail family protein [Robertmurraya sp. DFI.2.37]